ncbi:MAG: HAMP domain-containing histidine kinase [Bombella apis]|uniref:ATP-binding protein n=1 Tax=Bombella apis TaxID=1785988 RepID=UPI0023F3F272|nr:ATP-binding protein [Bombella apis]MCT6819692.1 HAMP domain-containing histidine kinase [Bombella apis]
MASPLLPEIITAICACLALTGWAMVWHLSRRPHGTTRPDSPRPSAPPPGSVLPFHEATLLVDTIPGMALILGSVGQIMACNEAARTHYGNSLGALLRHPTAHSTLHSALHAPPMDDGLPAPCSTTIRLDVPVKCSVHLAMRRLPGAAGRNSLVLVLLHDRSLIQAVDRMRADFVAHASHELRTPLASLTGFIDLMKEGGDQTDQTSRTLYLEIMSQQATRMQRLIDRLLYLSQLEMKGHHHPQEELEAEELFALVLGEVTPRFQHDSRRLTVTQEDSLTLLANRDEMVQVLLNLIENAIRYGTMPERTLHVRLHARRATPAEGPTSSLPGLLITVEDNGPGIAAHHLPRLTERFYRITPPSDSSHAEAGQGTGLGLAIVRQILERHGGQLHFTSTVGQGTTCHVWLPAAPLPQDQTAGK